MTSVGNGGKKASADGKKILYVFKTVWRDDGIIPWILLTHSLPNVDVNEAPIINLGAELKAKQRDLNEDLESTASVNLHREQEVKELSKLTEYRASIEREIKEIKEIEKEAIATGLRDMVVQCQEMFQNYSRDILNVNAQIEFSANQRSDKLKDLQKLKTELLRLRLEKRKFAIIIKTQRNILKLVRNFAKLALDDELGIEANNFHKDLPKICRDFIRFHDDNIERLEKECELDLNPNLFSEEELAKLERDEKSPNKADQIHKSVAPKKIGEIPKGEAQKKVEIVSSRRSKRIEKKLAAKSGASPALFQPAPPASKPILEVLGDRVLTCSNDARIEQSELQPNLLHLDRYYTADFINVLMVGCFAIPNLRVYPAYTLDQCMENTALDFFIRQRQPYAFIPLQVPFDSENSPEIKNHWVALIIDKQHRQIFYLDPAQKPVQVGLTNLLKSKLGFNKAVILNPVNCQSAEQEASRILHCGVYIVEIFIAFAKKIRENAHISGSTLIDANFPESCSVLTVLSEIACGQAERANEYRRAHIQDVDRIVRQLIAQEDQVGNEADSGTMLAFL